MLLERLIFLAILFPPSLAFSSYQDRIPNGNNVPHPCKASYRWPSLGHEHSYGGGTRNDFDVDFQKSGYKWTQTLCLQDSDGDGHTNGEELGDPECTWSVGGIPSRTHDVTHPGVCEPYDSEKCKGHKKFVSCDLKGLESCDIIGNKDVNSLDLRFRTTTIPASETNYYCMTFDLPSDQDYHLVANEPIIDNDKVHHILLHGCQGPMNDEIKSPEPCGMQKTGNCGTIIALWSIGMPGTCHGHTAGFRIGQTGYKRVKMEIHYNNPKMISGSKDSSGLKLYIQPAKPEVQDLITFVTGQNMLEIPPVWKNDITKKLVKIIHPQTCKGKDQWKQVGVCDSNCTYQILTKPVMVISAINHMHFLGRSMKIELYRNGHMIKELTNDNHYSYDSPVSHVHQPPVKVLPGDEIVTTCVFNSLSSPRYVYYGEATSDEMCYGYLTAYPREAFTNQWCISSGQMGMCDLMDGTPMNGCDWKTFLNMSHPQMTPMVSKLSKNCNLNGFCRPECRQILKELKDHPCLTGVAGQFVKEYLVYTKAGLEFLGRLHSCPDGRDKTCNLCTCTN